MFDLPSFPVLVMLVTVVCWFGHATWRLMNQVSAATERVRAIREQYSRDAKALLKGVQDIDRLTAELKDNREAIETTIQAAAKRRQEIEAYAPPAPPSIYVPAEFPASKRDQAWVVRLQLAGTAGTKQPATASEKYLLVWAVDYALACGRARQMLGRLGFEPVAGHRLG